MHFILFLSFLLLQVSAQEAIDQNTIFSVPTDDDYNHLVDSRVDYNLELSNFKWVVPSPHLPRELKINRSNNNVAIAIFQNKLFLAFRTAPTHFASKKTKIVILSSVDNGFNWQIEKEIFKGTDLREPNLYVYHGHLYFFYFEGGSNPFKFEPKQTYQLEYLSHQNWSSELPILEPEEVPWDVKVRNDKIWVASYKGAHYGSGPGKIHLNLKYSTDTQNFNSSEGEGRPIYIGGNSEFGFDFDQQGQIWGVSRNEDGDASGFGSNIAFKKSEKDQWNFETHESEIYESPKMFRHGDDLYLVARRDIGGPFERTSRSVGFFFRKWANLISYSFRPKRTSIYKLNKETRSLEFVIDLPSTGDTAFPSIVRTGPHDFLIANYTSPLNRLRRKWIAGQISRKGTQIYTIELKFKPKTFD